jgi:hypothetical protein
MKKLAPVFSAIIAATIISHVLVANRTSVDLPVGKIELPIDGSLNTWCVAKAPGCSTINYAKKPVI